MSAQQNQKTDLKEIIWVDHKDVEYGVLEIHYSQALM